MSTLARIRNFAIIAHIDHGKSTLSDRLIQLCGGLSAREMKERVLDSMALERERGITIKSQTARLSWQHEGKNYMLNLVDTPGHVDFAYEVSRSLAACEGALVLIDAAQGVEAQTLANVYAALENDLDIIPVLNKVDLPAANVQATKKQIEDIIGIDSRESIEVSGKTGFNIEALPAAIVRSIKPPSGDSSGTLSALLIDSWYNPFLGVSILVRVKNGTLKRGDKVKLLATNTFCVVDRLGIFTPKPIDVDTLAAGEIGFAIVGLKSINLCQVGDTLTHAHQPIAEPLAGFQKKVSVVFCGLYPTNKDDHRAVKDALGKLALNDSAIHFEPETSAALGFGFRCGFQGLLHLEITQERLRREYKLDLVTTAPSVVYKITTTDGRALRLHNPSEFPDPTTIRSIEEPWVRATIFCPQNAVGAILELLESRRGEQKEMNATGDRFVLVYSLPLNEILYDFYDRLKSISRGYASFDYTQDNYRPGELVKVDILINGENAEPLSMIVHRQFAEQRGRQICERLKDLIPRQLFKIALQATIGGRIIARETISALRKDVTAKCYGGDFTRKRKLLEKQKAGKKRMQKIGKIDIPHDSFVKALRMADS